MRYNKLISKNKELHFYKKLLNALIIPTLLFFASCASLDVQYGKDAPHPNPENPIMSESKPEHSIYLIGDTGNAGKSNTGELFEIINDNAKNTDTASSLIFLGNNIYPHGLPVERDTPEREQAKTILKTQIEFAKEFPGEPVFIPGNRDWHTYERLKEQERYIKKRITVKKTFLPRNGCAIDHKNLNDSLSLVVIDSQWVLENWDKTDNINADCEIKTREDFYEEFESRLNKNQNKLTVVAVHHPMLSNGLHGGQYTPAKAHLFPLDDSTPLPVLGSLITLVRKTGGMTKTDLQHNSYRNFVNRISTLVADRDNVIFVSGHENSLQYLENDDIRQVISGSASKNEGARAVNKNDFSYGKTGFARLDVYPELKSVIRFYGIENGREKLLFEKQISGKEGDKPVYDFQKEVPETIVSQIYPDEATKKSGFYNFAFGKYYRDYYSTPIEVPTLDLTTFQGGLTPVRKGGGHQTNSLRLETKDGKQYVMRALEKSATRFLQALMFQEQWVQPKFEDTFTERFIKDFYTSSNPYYPFMVGELADPIGIYHTNPELYYVPKQPALGKYNDDFGDELYMVEERPMKAFNDLESFGKPEDIISSTDMLAQLRKNEKATVDEKLYIRARLFDMLIGDWDRHQDQWRWGEFNENDKLVYRPIPRDRDQVFPKYERLISALLLWTPMTSHMQSFGPKLKNVKQFNMEPYPLDLAVLQHATLEDWLEEADYIITHLTDEEIDNSFRNIPDEIRDDNIKQIKEYLKIRKQDLRKYAEAYFKVLNRKPVLYATDKKDKIIVKRLPKGKTQVLMYRIKKSGEELVFNKTYDKKSTKEIWIFGLNDDDQFIVEGQPENPIKIKLAGGYGDDTYQIEKGRKVKVYDFKTHNDEIISKGGAGVFLNDDYDLNLYDYRRPRYNDSFSFPIGGYNPDSGLNIGFSNAFSNYGFISEPFEKQHTITAQYFFATNGYELSYDGDFAKVFGQWFMGLHAHYAGSSYTLNFFGFGNETENPEDELGMDFNRVRIQTARLAPSIYKIWPSNAELRFKLNVEENKPQKTEGRIAELLNETNPELFDRHYFGGAGVKFSYSNYDIISLPSMGIRFEAEADWIMDLEDSKRNFPALKGLLSFTHRITKNDVLVLSTTLRGKTIFNNKFEFYQAATIGGEDVRGYRLQRFTGRHALSNTNNLRLSLGQANSFLFPIKYGIFGGYDIGRVWMDGESSNKWHQAAGGGFWINGVNMITADVSYFYGSDGGRLAIGFRFGF